MPLYAGENPVDRLGRRTSRVVESWPACHASLDDWFLRQRLTKWLPEHRDGRKRAGNQRTQHSSFGMSA